MRVPLFVLFLLLAQSVPSDAHALDPSAAVKATVVLKAEASWDGRPIVYPQGRPEVTAMIIEIAPGAETGWHLHPVPSFAIVLEGELEVRQRNGDVKRLRPGEGLAEVVDTLHNGHSMGSTPVRLAVFYAGATGVPLTVKHE